MKTHQRARGVRMALCVGFGSLHLLRAGAQNPAPVDAVNVPNVAKEDALRHYVESLHGEKQEAGGFLLEYLPAMDRGKLTEELFRENIEEAYVARETYPWTKELPKELFFNDVLPHAVADETRDPWRRRLRAMFDPQVAGCKDLREAFDAVSSKLGELTGVKYGTNREKACQSPAESMRQGVASCTGLAILMVDALRAMGIPARLVAIPMWAQLDGNHTWVEVHDGQGWRVTDYGRNAAVWDKGWEIERCATCDPEIPFHGVFVSSYRPTGIGFPTVWNWRRPSGNALSMVVQDYYELKRGSAGEIVQLSWKMQREAIPGIDRTAHYIALAGGRKLAVPKGSACLAVRAFLKGSKTRVDVPLRVFRGAELLREARTASEALDLNDYARILCATGTFEVAFQTADGSWRRETVEAVADKETEVVVELSEAEAGGFFSVAQRRALADWFRNRAQPWPGTADWPSLVNAEAVRDASAVLWSIAREAERPRKNAVRSIDGGSDHQRAVQEGRGSALDDQPDPSGPAARKREARPETVVWTAQPLDGKRIAYSDWIGLQTDALGTDVHVVAKRIPGDNAVEIDAKTVPGGEPLVNAALTVLLDDELVDLDREVKVVCNGKAVFAGRFVRSVETLARTMSERGDPRMAFPVRLDIRIDVRDMSSGPMRDSRGQEVAIPKGGSEATTSAPKIASPGSPERLLGGGDAAATRDETSEVGLSPRNPLP